MASTENYVWARNVLEDIDEGRARGNRLALRIRARLQSALFRLGCTSQRHCGKFVLLGFVFMAVFAIGLTRAKLETRAEKLWVEVGGRLAEEIRYSEAALGKEFGLTQEVLIQTPNYKGTNILTVEAMLLHLKALKKAAKVKVKIDGIDREWSLKDLCYAPNLPAFDDKLLQKIMQHLLPCTIVTPLDCFWEGAKIHGLEVDVILPDDPLKKYLKWTSLNPVGLLNDIQKKFFLYPWEMEKIQLMFREAGITTGYLQKPCLNPKDPECPSLAPNFNSKEVPDVGSVLTGGCNGFAANYMEWPEEMIVGGVTKNRSGTIRSASALQSAVLLMGASNLLEYYQDKDWASYIAWNLTTTKRILAAWQNKFTKEMNEITDPKKDEFSILAFSLASFEKLLKDFSKTSTFRLAMGYVLMLVYSGLTLKRWNDAVQSQGALGVAGVLLVTVAVASGLGFCSFCGIALNAASTQVLPFLALGLGVDDMFLLAHTYAAISERGEIHPSDQVGYALSNTGVSIFLTSFNNMFAFLMAAIIPIPALRAFSFQAAVIVVFNYLAVIIVYPAMLAIDVKRKQDQRYDLFCCLQRDGPQRISSTDSALVLRRYHNSNSSLSSMSSSAMNGAVVLPGGMQATASAVSLPETVTVTASAVAELTNRTMLPLSVSKLVAMDDLGINTVNVSDGRPRAGNAHRIERRDQTSKVNFSTDIVPRPLHHGRRDIPASVPTGRRHLPRTTSKTIIEQTLQPVARINGRSSTQSDGEPTRNAADVETTTTSKWNILKEKLQHFSLTNFAKYYYGPWLQKSSTKVFVLFTFAALFAAGIYGCLLVRDGLDLADVVPRNSSEHKFVTAQMKYFSIYPMYLVTMKDFDYTKGQKLLYKYHDAFKSVTNVIKTPEMKLRPFWLMYFRNWLKDIQKAFDEDWARGAVSYEGWRGNATDSGILGYKLMAQTGNEDMPINISQVRSVRLVNEEGIINPKAFYNYLTVWYNVDPMGFTSSQGNIRPKPGNWVNSRDVKEYHNMRIQATKPIEFAQITFYLVNLKETSDYVRVIKKVREICDEYKTRGLPSYPSGIPFIFWEQYIWLRHNILVAIAVILAVSFVVMMVVLCNVWAAMIIVATLTAITVQVFGFMGLAGIKLSAVPAVTLILSVGVGVEFTVHMCLAFQTALGDKNTRMQKAIEQVFSPITDGAVSTLLGVIMLAGSEFDFIVRYFFHLLCALIIVGFMNGLIFLPVLLSFIGPSPEVEDNRPPGTASSAGSQRELLPVSSCRRGTPPTDSQICILETSTHDSRHDDRTESNRRYRKRQRGETNYGNRRVHASNSHKSSTPTRIQYDLESSSSVVARVTATATVTVQVKTEQIPNDRTMHEHCCDTVHPNRTDGGVTIVDLNDHSDFK